MKRPVVFLDRDGVINHDSAAYIKHPDEFEFIDQSPEAIALLCDKGFDVILITNQSMIGRKMATEQTLGAIFDKMATGVDKAGGRIKDIFYCPHLPDAGCGCRKPRPGLILAARDRWDIDLSASVMVGDSAKDILAGKNAGCGATLLVKTGNGIKALSELEKENQTPEAVVEDLYQAALWITRHFRP